MIAQKFPSKEDMEFKDFKYLTWERTFLWQEVSINRNISQTSYITNTFLYRKYQTYKFMNWQCYVFRITPFFTLILKTHIRILYLPIPTLYTVTKYAICWRGKLSFVIPVFCRNFDVTINYIVPKVGGEHGR